MRRTAGRANVQKGVHILRHSFCSHLTMRGAPARAIQELAGHQDLMTTQRYMHLSPAALDAAVRLLEGGTAPAGRGAHVEAAGTGGHNPRACCTRSWWRRRESNPRPKARRRGTL